MKYILGTLGIIVLLIVAVVLIAGNGDSNTDQSGKPQLELTDFVDKDGVFSWTQQGEITGNEDYKSIRITISRSERRVEVLTGYDEAVERSQGFANTQSAYDNFVRALDNAGFSRERKSVENDSRGVCPMGNRFIYILREGGEDQVYLWSTSCRGQARGTFGGDASTIKQLFQNQIPNFRDFAKDVKL